YIEEIGPDLSWVYLEYTDTIAHGFGDSPELTSIVQVADSRVGRLWDAVKQRQQRHDEKWLIIVTTDHGRDAQTGKSHGGQTDRERAIWIATNSSGLTSNFGDNTALVDILPSIVQHLKLTMPAEVEVQLDGQSFIQ
ncbi:MAG: alkaline phosphatase family protein, partial [Arenicella sp.]|nr:alkaline phosphatase family protein [Arenicella sp.]